METLFSIGQAARMLGIQAYRISYAIDTGQLPEPQVHFLHKRCFNEQEIKTIAGFFNVDLIERQEEAQ